MPPKKFTDLAADTVPAAADIMAVSQSPFGAGSSKKVTLANLWFQLQKWLFAADSVGTDSYAITLSPAITAYTDGQLYRFKAGTANTGAATLAINGLAAKTIKKMAGGLSDLATNDIRAGQMVDVVYDLSNDCFQMQSSVGNLAGGAAVNPTSLFFPYNNAGVFADSPLKRVDANNVRQQNGTNAQRLTVCEDDGTSELRMAVVTTAAGVAEFGYERASASSTTARLVARNSGATSGGSAVQVSGSGPFECVASMDLGRDAANRWNNTFAQAYYANGGSGPYFVWGPPGNVNGVQTYLSSNALVVRRGNDSAGAYVLDAGRSFVSSQFDKTNTTLADITGLTSPNLIAGREYSFEAVLFVDADVTGGFKFAIAGTCTAGSIKYQIMALNNATSAYVITSRQTALGGSAGGAGPTALFVRIVGSISVSGTGTLTVQFAQNAASGTSSILTRSKFRVEQTDF